MAHFEDCKFFLRGTCAKGLRCGFRHDEAARQTERLCNRWAAGYTCDGRCNLRHPSSAELAALAAAPLPTPSAATVPTASRATQQSAAKPHLQQQQQQQRRDGTARAPAAAPASSTTPPAPPCRFHARGLCAKGVACPFYHAPRTATPTPTAGGAAAAEEGRNNGRTYPIPNTLRGAAAAARKIDDAKNPAAVPASGKAGKKGGQRAAGAGRGLAVASGRAAGRGSSSGGGGLGVAADAAAAKERAAEILQKHRLSSSTAATHAKARGGMRIAGGPPLGKKVRTESPMRRQPQRPATGGNSSASASTAAKLPTPKDPKKRAGDGLALEGKEVEWDCGEKGHWGGKVDAPPSGFDGAPACDDAVARVPSDQPPHEQRQERPEPVARETCLATKSTPIAMEVAATSSSSEHGLVQGVAAATGVAAEPVAGASSEATETTPIAMEVGKTASSENGAAQGLVAAATDAAGGERHPAGNNNGTEAASLIPGAAAATVIASDKEGAPQDRPGGVVDGGSGLAAGDGVEPDVGGQRASLGDDQAGGMDGKEAEAPPQGAAAAALPDALAAGSPQEG